MREQQEIIGQESSLKTVFKIVTRVAPTDSTVLVTGESGTGKELVVRALHAMSKRSQGPFVPVNCGAIPHDLLESELFGHEKGAFTGAVHARQGRFELANGGTIFLDEIGEMDMALQVKLLRVLQEREIERVGSDKAKKVDVRVVAATNRDLEAEVAKGAFRGDLYYRLNVIPIVLPPLRKRGQDILLLANSFLTSFCRLRERPLLRLSSQASQVLLHYPWPGNVRELENIMERISILAEGEQVELEDLPSKILKASGFDASTPLFTDNVALEEQTRATTLPMQEPKIGSFAWPVLADLDTLGLNLREFMDTVEMRLIGEALDKEQGIRKAAAKRLGINRTTLLEKIRRKGLE